VERGAEDGQQVIFRGVALEQGTGDVPGDVSFVLQERRHARWQRRGLDLYLECPITLLEALAGYQVAFEHLDRRTLYVKSRPGEVVRPQNLLHGVEADWQRFDNTDAFPGQDAGHLKTGDLEACKDICRRKAYSGFTYWEDTAYFRSQERTALLDSKQKSRGSTLFVCPDPKDTASLRVRRAVRCEGMPALGHPQIRGNLFLLLRVQLPKHIDDMSARVLLDILPSGGAAGAQDSIASAPSEPTLEELELCDLDPTQSRRRHHIATGGNDDASRVVNDGRDEAHPAGSPGPPPPCPQM